MAARAVRARAVHPARHLNVGGKQEGIQWISTAAPRFSHRSPPRSRGAASAAAGQTAPPAKAGDPPPGLPQPTETIDLWPAGAPGMPAKPPVETTVEEVPDRSINDRAVQGVVEPRLVVFRPKQPNGAAMLLMPGGGYRRIVVDREGYELARWLSDRGITCSSCSTVCREKAGPTRADVPLQDAQRAMRLIPHAPPNTASRQNGWGQWVFPPAAICAPNWRCATIAKIYEPVDAADAMTAKPFVAAPIYPVISMIPSETHAGSHNLLLGANPSQALQELHSPFLHVTAATPPCFLCAAEDDGTVPVKKTPVLFHDALRAQKISVEMHLFAHGGHGFGLRHAIGKPVAIWPELFFNWAKAQAFV